MHVIFDIDGTLANAEHRLHWIKDMEYWISVDGKPTRPNWETFLSDELVAKDTAISPVWNVLNALHRDGHKIIFITSRPEKQRELTTEWLNDIMTRHFSTLDQIKIYMRKDGDRRPSEVVKEEGLYAAIEDGYFPQLVFEDRKSDTEMWRRHGLLCCQVAEGNY